MSMRGRISIIAVGAAVLATWGCGGRSHATDTPTSLGHRIPSDVQTRVKRYAVGAITEKYSAKGDLTIEDCPQGGGCSVIGKLALSSTDFIASHYVWPQPMAVVCAFGMRCQPTLRYGRQRV